MPTKTKKPAKPDRIQFDHQRFRELIDAAGGPYAVCRRAKTNRQQLYLLFKRDHLPLPTCVRAIIRELDLSAPVLRSLFIESKDK